MAQVIMMGAYRWPLTIEQRPRIYFKGGIWRVEQVSKPNTKVVREARDRAAFHAVYLNEKLYEQAQKESTQPA